jgi:uncharacterized delta-60 repeat protein
MRISTWLRPLIVRLSRTRPRRLARRPAFRPRLEGLEDRLTPSGGGLLDPTFGSGGVVLNSTGTDSQALTDVTVLPDGKLLAAGYMRGTSGGNNDFAAARYNADGTFDTSFGSGGLATVDFRGGDDKALAAAIQPGTGGKILLAGSASSQFGLIRLNPNGTLDTTFGDKASKGKVTANPDAHHADYAYDMAVLPDGKILLAGVSKNLASTAHGSLALARFNADGTPDTTFGNKGTVLTTTTVDVTAGSLFHPVNVAVDGNGRIVVSGSNPLAGNTDFLVARFNANGSPDTTFGAAHSGVVTTDLLSGSYDRAYALTLQSDGKIVVGGWASPQTGREAPAAVARYNPDGSPDQTFGAGGVALIDADPVRVSATVVRAAVVQPDGKILLAGDGNYLTPKGDGTYDVSGNMVEIIRLNADGTPDATYGPAGTGASSTAIGYNARVAAMALLPDGRAVVAGAMNTAQNVESFALTRFLGSAPSPSPVQVGSFAATPNPVAAGSPVTLTAGGVTTANAGATVTRVAFYAVDASGAVLFLGYGVRNADGTWTLTLTPNLAPGRYRLLALAADSTGSVSDPLAADLDVT